MNQAILDLAEGRAKATTKIQEPNTKKDKDQDPPTPTHRGVLKIDATVALQKIAFPTDLNLLNKAREHTEAIIDAFCLHLTLKKPRTYRKLARKNYLSVIRKKKKSFKVVRKAIKQQLQYLRRNLCTIDHL